MEFVRLLTSFSGNFMANFSWVDCEYRGGDGGILGFREGRGRRGWEEEMGRENTGVKSPTG